MFLVLIYSKHYARSCKVIPQNLLEFSSTYYVKNSARIFSENNSEICKINFKFLINELIYMRYEKLCMISAFHTPNVVMQMLIDIAYKIICDCA